MTARSWSGRKDGKLGDGHHRSCTIICFLLSVEPLTVLLTCLLLIAVSTVCFRVMWGTITLVGVVVSAGACMLPFLTVLLLFIVLTAMMTLLPMLTPVLVQITFILISCTVPTSLRLVILILLWLVVPSTWSRVLWLVISPPVTVSNTSLHVRALCGHFGGRQRQSAIRL